MKSNETDDPEENTCVKFDLIFNFAALQAVGIENPSKPIPSGDKIDRRTFITYL
jgi:hypothetical protein